MSIMSERFEISLGEDLYLRGEAAVKAEAGQKEPVVFVLHGFKSFMDWGFHPYIMKTLAEHGFYAVRFNFSCNGVKETDFDELDKFAKNTYSRELQDVSTLLEGLLAGRLPLSEYADTGRIGLIGHSRGGGDAVLFAAEHPEIRAVVTWNGISNTTAMFNQAFREELAKNGVVYIENARTKQQMPIGPDVLEDLEKNGDRYSIMKRFAELQIPVLMIQGDKDSERLQQGFRALQEANPHQSFITIAGGNHTFGAVHPFAGTTPHLEEALKETIEFLGKHL